MKQRAILEELRPQTELRPPQLAASFRVEVAYERALKALSLVDRSEPISNLVAKEIIELYQTGIRDTGQRCELAVKQLDPR